MPDVRDILREGADIEPGLPDVPELARRGRNARRRRTLAQALAAGVCAAVVVAVLARFMPEQPAPDLQPVAPSGAQPVPSSPGPLAAGVYDASAWGLGLRFTVPGPGWTLTVAQDGWVGLRHGRSTLDLQQWDRLVDPDADPVGPTDVVPVPVDLVAWLTSHPRMQVGGVAAMPLGGETWTAVELTVRRALTSTPAECNTLRCVLLAVSGDEPVDLLSRDRARVLVPPDPGSPVVVLSQPASQEEPDDAADDLTDSLIPD